MNADRPLRRKAETILTLVQEGRAVVEDFVPLTESLDFELGQQYFRERGSHAFISDSTPVPFTINNDGSLSRRTAELFFAGLAESEKKEPLESTLHVLELGIGVGLFARLFLDSFKDLCSREGKDYYRRLVYIAADRSERMLADACRHGTFANHPGRYLIRVVDALEPGKYLSGDLALPEGSSRPLRAVFLNYVLDCLPAAHLKITADEVRQLCAQTCVARTVNLAEHTRLTPNELARRARSGSAGDRREVMKLYSLLAAEYDYRPVKPDQQLPYQDFAVRFAREHKVEHLLHNQGAIRSLEGLLALLHPHGFIAINDYGQIELPRAGDFEHQHFSQSTCIGLNFPLLQAYFGESGKCRWIEPDGEHGHIYSRLLGSTIGPETTKAFTERFGEAAWERCQEKWQAARANLQRGRFEPALTAYHEAIERQPNNWVLLNEVACFLTETWRNPAAGLAVAKEALALNPSCSADLWNTLGDAYYRLGKLPEASSAYRRALRVNAGDIRARVNLAWVYLDQRRYKDALTMIAEGLALDETGQYHEGLIKKQNEIMAHLTQRNQQRMFLMANRVSSKPGGAQVPRPEKSDNDRPATGSGKGSDMVTTVNTNPGTRLSAKGDGQVTIIVTCCGQLEYTRYGAPSLLRFSRQPCEFVFLDCDSMDGTSEYLGGFAAASSIRIEVAHIPTDPPISGQSRKDETIPIRGDFVALLNNDTIVTQGWLERLVSLCNSAADIGMVAPMSNHAPADLRVDQVPYGLELAADDAQTGIRANPWPEIDKVNRFGRQWQEQNQGQAFAVNSIDGGCAVLKREVLQQLGLFPTRTPLGIFDFAGLSDKVRHLNYKLLGCREVFIHNFGSRSAIRR
jgi:tetratricopeptide (TPR) repeat protein